MKPGIKTTELVVSLLGILGGLACAIWSDSQWSTIVGGVLAAIRGGSYTVGRSLVKGREAIGQAQVAAAREIAKKG